MFWNFSKKGEINTVAEFLEARCGIPLYIYIYTERAREIEMNHSR